MMAAATIQYLGSVYLHIILGLCPSFCKCLLSLMHNSLALLVLKVFSATTHMVVTRTVLSLGLYGA